jgi:hypothetical protein
MNKDKKPRLLEPGVCAELATGRLEKQAIQAMQASNQAVQWLRDPDDPAASVFFAASPEDAFRWICQHSSEERVTQYVGYELTRQQLSGGPEEMEPNECGENAGSEDEVMVIDNERGVIENEARLSNTDCASLDKDNGGQTTNRTTTTTAKASARVCSKTNNTRRLLLKKQAKDLAAYRAFFSNSQEVESDVREESKFNRERANWLRFAGKQPEAKRAGTSAVAELVRRASVVGNAEAIEDFQMTLLDWRKSAKALSSNPAPDALAMCRTSSIPDERFRYHYQQCQRAESLGARCAIERRFHAARAREEYDIRVARRRDPNRDPPISTRDLGVIQRDMFALVSPEHAEVEPDNLSWSRFQRMLKHGRRWLALERAFTCGIFALIPKTRVPNTFLERKLSDEHFALFIRLLVHCSPLVTRMAKAISDVVERLANEGDPPDYLLELELESSVLPHTEQPTADLAGLLERVDVDSRVQEVDVSEADIESESDRFDEGHDLESVFNAVEQQSNTP